MAEPKAPAAPADGGGVKGALARKIGPLPTWAWVAIIAGAIVLYELYSSSSSSSSGTASTAQSTTPPVVVANYTNVPPSAPEPPGTPGWPRSPAEGFGPRPGTGGGGQPYRLYWHSRTKPPKVTRGGENSGLGKGFYQIGGKTYYYHGNAKHPFWTLKGSRKRINPPSGLITPVG